MPYPVDGVLLFWDNHLFFCVGGRANIYFKLTTTTVTWLISATGPRPDFLSRADACKLGCEGIVSKRLGSLYRSGRSPHWVKVKRPESLAMKREAEEGWAALS